MRWKRMSVKRAPEEEVRMTPEWAERIEQVARDFAHGYGISIEEAAAKINAAMQVNVSALCDLFERTAAFVVEWEER